MVKFLLFHKSGFVECNNMAVSNDVDLFLGVFVYDASGRGWCIVQLYIPG